MVILSLYPKQETIAKTSIIAKTCRSSTLSYLYVNKVSNIVSLQAHVKLNIQIDSVDFFLKKKKNTRENPCLKDIKLGFLLFSRCLHKFNFSNKWEHFSLTATWYSCLRNFGHSGTTGEITEDENFKARVIVISIQNKTKCVRILHFTQQLLQIHWCHNPMRWRGQFLLLAFYKERNWDWEH